ncbi:MAG: HEAT repeat domain-containing protein [Myxococcales bacterium]|nr:HEAT repeat domain-containing protein [Myxococcales bacterium]
MKASRLGPRASSVLVAIALACGSKEKAVALRDLTSASAKQRAQGVKSLEKLHASDDESWAALTRAARDGAAPVRAGTAAAMAATRRDDAPDAISALLRDPDDSVRIAAARALATRCNDRATAYLGLAFGHSDAAVRAEVVQALQTCGVKPEHLLAREESERRRKAIESSVDAIPAIRARGARELGLLGRDEDRKRLLALLGDRDGVVVAAAARALGDAGALDAAPRLQALLAEKGEIASAAAEALFALGPKAIDPARPALEKLAVLESDESLPAAAALASPGQFCADALAAQNAQAASMLAEGCPAAPFAKALGTAKKRDPLYESLLRAQGEAPGLDAALARFLKAGDADARIPRIAERYRAAGPALVAALEHEQAVRAKGLAEKRTEPDEGSAAEIAKTPAGNVPNRERYARLMALLQERAGAESAKASAAVRLNALLHGDAAADKRGFIAGALRAALAMKAPRAEQIAAKFVQDPDPFVAAAARGELEAAPGSPPAKPPLEARLALWSDDAAVRGRACATAGPDLAETRRLLAAADPERRVRDACSSTNETAPAK